MQIVTLAFPELDTHAGGHVVGVNTSVILWFSPELVNNIIIQFILWAIIINYNELLI